MKNVRRGLATAAIVLSLCILLGAGMLAFGQNGNSPAKIDTAVMGRLDAAIDRVHRLPFQLLLSKQVIHEFLQDKRGGDLYAARKTAWNEYLCPAFGDKHDDGKRCFDALYGANTGAPTTEYWYSRLGVPVAAAEKVRAFRNLMMEKAKASLQSPADVRALYTQHKNDAVTEIRAMQPQDRQRIVAILKNAQLAFDHFRDNSDHYQDDHWKTFGFASRRYAEGGQPLVDAYKYVVNDLLQSIG